MPEAVLAAEGVSKRFRLRPQGWRQRAGVVEAVCDVTLAVGAGEVVGLVGESGCGKSTLARLLAGLIAPDQGQVLLQGRPRSAWPSNERLAAHRMVQMVFQDPANSLNPRMTAGESLEEPLIVHRLVPRAERARRVESLLGAVELPASYRRRLPWALSGGERQRVGIARALATDPAVLICDEPISSLDVSVGAKILALLQRLRAEHRMALLFISHDLRAVAALCGRIAVMSKGRIVEAAPTETLLSRPANPYTELLIRCASLDLDAADAV